MRSALAGEVVFDGVPIFVSPGAVMTPVSGTVALVEVAVERIGSRSVRVADVGTGTGAVAVAVALRVPRRSALAGSDETANPPTSPSTRSMRPVTVYNSTAS